MKSMWSDIRKMFLFCLLSGCFSTIAIGQEGSAFEVEPSWEENFERNGIPDVKNWNILSAHWKPELQLYTQNRENVRVDKGHLIIEAHKKDTIGCRCTSAYISTKGKVNFLHGKLEFRAKLPLGRGIWPAIWMLSNKSEYPKGEIDIVEYIGCWGRNQFQMNVHVFRQKNVQTMNEGYCRCDVSSFHVYTMEWHKDRMIFKTDGEPFAEYHRNNKEAWVFDVPYYLIINLAYGGWGASCGLDDNIFPCRMEIDWIRYYKLKE